MAKLSKENRYEVFKNDHFTCQYCHQIAPNVLLEIGNANSLITSCSSCNQEKRKTKLSANTKTAKTKTFKEDLAQRKEQLEMLQKWQTELILYYENLTEKLVIYWERCCGGEYQCDEKDRLKFKQYAKKFRFDILLNSMEVSIDYYIKDINNILMGEWANAVNKVGGIAYNLLAKKEVA